VGAAAALVGMRMSAAIAPPETPNATAIAATTAIGLRALEKIMSPPSDYSASPQTNGIQIGIEITDVLSPNKPSSAFESHARQHKTAGSRSDLVCLFCILTSNRLGARLCNRLKRTKSAREHFDTAAIGCGTHSTASKSL
jgi:hypothetical protein